MTKTPRPVRTTYHVGDLRPLLLSAAKQRLEELGPTRLTLRAVADAVGVSSAAAYHHFSSHSELLEHVAALGFKDLSAALAASGSSSRKKTVPREHRLRETCRAYFRFARRNAALYQLMFGPEFSKKSDLTPELRAAQSDACRQLQQIMAEILEKPIASPLVRSAMAGTWSYCHGLALLVLHGSMELPDSVDEDALLEGALNGLWRAYQVGRAAKPEKAGQADRARAARRVKVASPG